MQRNEVSGGNAESPEGGKVGFKLLVQSTGMHRARTSVVNPPAAAPWIRQCIQGLRPLATGQRLTAGFESDPADKGTQGVLYTAWRDLQTLSHATAWHPSNPCACAHCIRPSNPCARARASTCTHTCPPLPYSNAQTNTHARTHTQRNTHTHTHTHTAQTNTTGRKPERPVTADCHGAAPGRRVGRRGLALPCGGMAAKAGFQASAPGASVGSACDQPVISLRSACDQPVISL